MTRPSTAADPTPERLGTLGDILAIRERPTVVRLDDLDRPASAWIEEGYHLTAEVRNHLEALRVALSRRTGAGVFLIGQYGCGKSHFLAYLTRRLEAGDLTAAPPHVARISLLNFRGLAPLEKIVAGSLGIQLSDGDRRTGWAAAGDRHPEGIVLIVDELSEFLRSKPDARSFNEDVRFLQFLGEWAQGARFWLVAAMQEQIEHTGELEHGLYQKIKDRFPIRLLLTSTHVHDLIRDGILDKKPGYEGAVRRIVSEIREALPWNPVDEAAVLDIYPVHPAAIAILDEIRDRFSEARGVIDFVIARLCGDAARRIPRLLDGPVGIFLTPDLIVDHFRDQFETQSTFQPLAQQVLPWFREHQQALFAAPAAQELAERLLKLLILVHLAPNRRALSARDATAWLLWRPSRIDPDRNVAMVRKVLDQFADHGRFVVRDGSDYRLALEDDGGADLERRLRVLGQDIEARGDAIFPALAPLLKGDRFDPFSYAPEAWTPRNVRWHFHDRRVEVFVGNGEPPPHDGIGLVVRLPWEAAEASATDPTIVPQRIEVSPALVELAALVELRGRPFPPETRRRLETRLQAHAETFRARVRQAYAEAAFLVRRGEPLPLPRLVPNSTFDSFVDAAAETIFRRSYPTFDRFAPSHGPLPAEAYRSLLRHITQRDLDDAAADEPVQVVREAYLVPMGLVQRRGGAYMLAPALDKNEIVRLFMPLLEHQPAPKAVFEHFGGPGHGLVPDQVALVLIVLVAAGEIDLLKGKQSIRETFETLPLPIHYDRIVRAAGMSLNELRELQILCDGLSVKTPKQWTVLSQRQAIRKLAEEGRRERDRWQPFILKLVEQGEAPELAQRLRRAVSKWETLRTGEDELAQFQQFVYEIGTGASFLAERRELYGLPERIDRLQRERDRLRHLLTHPRIAESVDHEAAGLLESIGDPPGLERPEELESWLDRAARAYEAWKDRYRKAHDAFWRSHAARLSSLAPPSGLARSRHLGLSAGLEEWKRLQGELARPTCAAVSGLEFQPICRCGFDGGTHPVAAMLGRALALGQEMETTIDRFFAQDEVRTRLRAWQKDGVEAGPGLLAYLTGAAKRPEVANLDLLDRYLAGVAVVAVIDAGEILGALAGRTCEPKDLVQAFARLVEARGASRVRIDAEAPGDEDAGLAAWCVESALRHAIPLPAAFTLAARRTVAPALRPSWVSAESLRKLTALGLGDEILDAVVSFVAGGQVQVPEKGPVPPPVAAARELVRPTAPADAEGLGRLAAVLYGAHERMSRLRPEAWLDRLEMLAATPLAPEPPPLAEVLGAGSDAQWILVDALGWPLVEALWPDLLLLAGRSKAERTGAALVSSTSTTDGCYAALAVGGVRHGFLKVDAVDELLHDRMMPFDDLVRRARAELGVAARRVARELDPARPVLLFADHGFRLASDGRSWRHGGPSTLERAVPVIRFALAGPA